MNKANFQEFEGVSSKAWKQKIQMDLKGDDYNEALVWDSPDGIKVKPFYNSDDLADQLKISAPEKPFRIGQHIFVHDLEKSIHRALDVIARGAESLFFTIHNPNIDLEKLLEKLPLENIEIHFDFEFLNIEKLLTFDNSTLSRNAKIFYNLDPIENLTREGNWFQTDFPSNFDALKKFAEATNHSFLKISTTNYQNAGATHVQQIAYAVAHATEYFNHLPNLKNDIVIEVAIGSNYFFEIAKIRALRYLLELVSKEFGFSQSFHIVAKPSTRNKSIYDYNVNMLRTTTESMSAISGGADTIVNLPYDSLYHKSNEFGERISRNQLLILKKESYFDKVQNPADGTYYIESLTTQMAQKALELFKDIEQNGGFLVQLGEGTIQRKIAESADKEQSLFDNGENPRIGTTKHPNKNDLMANDLEIFPFAKNEFVKTLIKPIVEKRLTEGFEKERLETEKK